MNPRRLTVRKETLAELGAAELSGVAAGTVTVVRTSRCPTTPFFSGIYFSVNVDCTETLDHLSAAAGTCGC